MDRIYNYFVQLVNSSSISIINILDIAITAFLIYKIIGWIKGTQAEQVAKGIIIIIVVTQLSDWLGFVTINYILKNLMTVGLVAVIVMFQPELRRALERIGGTKFFRPSLFTSAKEGAVDIDTATGEIAQACDIMAKKHTGALIVIEKDARIDSIVSSGIILDSVVSSELFINIFEPNTPLHDGAVIVSSETLRIKAAACLLPLTQKQDLSKALGTRHRAAVGMSEICDALVVVVSEETGMISYAKNAHLTKNVTKEELQKVLIEHMTPENSKEENPEKKGWFKRK